MVHQFIVDGKIRGSIITLEVEWTKRAKYKTLLRRSVGEPRPYAGNIEIKHPCITEEICKK